MIPTKESRALNTDHMKINKYSGKDDESFQHVNYELHRQVQAAHQFVRGVGE